MTISRATWLPALLVLGAISPAGAHPSEPHQTATAEKIDASLQAPAAVVDAFHAALARRGIASAAAFFG